MSIVIRKQETGEVFDVVSGFKLEVENTSPVFNALGSKTVSTSLPKTDRNIRLLDYSNRLDIANKPRFKMPVVVSAGSYVRNGMLYLSFAYNTDHTFGITIAFNEGIMYENMSEIVLTELSGLPIIEKPIAALIKDMNELFTKDNPDAKLSVFYLSFKKQSYQITANGEQFERYFLEYVNGVKMTGIGKAELDRRSETVVIENNEPVPISVPPGYGITPFVRVWYVLELIFDHYGYKIKENPFRAQHQLKRLCVLNNTVDAIVGGHIDYKQLLPEVTIFEFLQSLYCRFGLKVFFNSNTGEISLKLLKDIFSHADHKPIDQASLLDIDYTAPKQLRLSAARNLDQSNVEFDSYEEFLTRYNNSIGKIADSIHNSKTGGIYYDIRAGLFYQYSTINDQAKLISSIHFDWNKKTESVETEDISSIDECITQYHPEDSGSAFLYYGLSPNLANSILNINDQETGMFEKNKLAFAYDMGLIYLPEANEKKYLGYKYGSVFPYAWQNSDGVLQEDADGNVFEYALTLVGEYGAFNNFFKEYDAFLRHSNHTVKFKMNAPAYQLSDIQFNVKRMIDHQPLLLDKVNHDLNDAHRLVATAEARSLRLYEPHDLDTEQEIPLADDIKYQWVQTDNREDQIKEKGREKGDEYKEANANNPLYQFISYGKTGIVSDPNPPGNVTYWFLPPTEWQYQNGVRVGERTHPISVWYTYTYRIRTDELVPIWTVYNEDEVLDFDYSSYFQADIIQ